MSILANPTLQEIDPGEEAMLDGDYTMNGPIPDGTVYRFTPSELSTKNFDKSAISLYPNPTSNQLNIKTVKEEMHYAIYNALGQELKSAKLSTDHSIDVSGLQNGVYFVKLKSDDAIVTKKFIKK